MIGQIPSPAFRSLHLADWRQFNELHIGFHPRVTMLTGANGTGKTTVLALLARHFNWSVQWAGVPIRNDDGTFAYWLRITDLPEWTRLGELVYGNDVVSEIRIPAVKREKARYDVVFSDQQDVPGLYLTSHRSANSYVQIDSIPARFSSPSALLTSYTNEIRNQQTGSANRKSPFAWFKESLIGAAVFGEGNDSVEADPVARDIWFGFQRVLADILPHSLGFERLKVRNPELIVRTRTGEFALDESSGGISALMQLGWQIFLRSYDQPSFLVLFDEPENHLHPELQRTIIPSLIRAFPTVQFVIATHSPFVVTSVADSFVYVLDYDGSNHVQARLLDQANKAGSADETLRRVLGLQSTMPLWAEDQFSSIMARYLTREMTSESLTELREDLRASGLQSSFPEAMVQAASRALEDPPR